jgi:hypothetical protein
MTFIRDIKELAALKKALQSLNVCVNIHIKIPKNMARQKGIIKLKGTIGGVSFYKTQDGDLAREKGGVDGSRIKNDDAFARTRENGAEFGSSASAGKLLRDAIRPLLLNTADNRVVSRLTKVMTDIKNLDATSARGERSVGVALTQAGAQALLKGFNFNKRSVLGSVLHKPFTVQLNNGMITINNLVPINDIVYPSGATHVSFKSAWAIIDFVAGTSSVEYSPVVNVPIDAVQSNVQCLPPGLPTGLATNLYLLALEFFQEVNGVQYSLKNGAYNALAIVEVA